MQKEIDGVSVVFPDEMAEEEAAEYVKRGRSKYGSMLKGMTIRIADDDENDVVLLYDVPRLPFHRLRRITGKPAK